MPAQTGRNVMSRVQLALRVADLEGSIAFYSKLFGAEPAKRRPGYANFAIAEPPLKLVLIEGQPGEPTPSAARRPARRTAPGRPARRPAADGQAPPARCPNDYSVTVLL